MTLLMAPSLSIGLLAVVATWLVLGALAAPVAAGIGAAVLVLAAQVPQLSVIPASVYGFASVAGLILPGQDMTPTAALVPTLVSIAIGAGFGGVSEALAGQLLPSQNG
jgi:Protein of unknown function (DUF1097)